ncbi:MAG: tetratricopeptide repeat protein [Myxococcota bacterium]
MRSLIAIVGLSTGALLACSPAPKANVTESPSPSPKPAEPEAPPPEPKPVLAEPEPTPAPDPKIVAEAERLYASGVALFRQGRYDEAELQLKQALNVYPFMASANLTLGKVFLIRGAAERDEVMIDSARLMFKMAVSIDPELREATVLLSLFDEAAE